MAEIDVHIFCAHGRLYPHAPVAALRLADSHWYSNTYLIMYVCAGIDDCSDRVIVFRGEAGIECTAGTPVPLLAGMNTFLRSLDVTFRRDPDSFRPRINKKGSTKDREQCVKSIVCFLFFEIRSPYCIWENALACSLACMHACPTCGGDWLGRSPTLNTSYTRLE